MQSKNPLTGILKQLHINIRSIKSIGENTICLLASIILSIAIWIAVSIAKYPTVETSVYGVPVEIDLDGSYAQSNSLQVMSSSAETVTVKVKGERGQVGNLTADDLRAVVDVSTVMQSKEYNLPMRIICDSNREFEVQSIEPSSINIYFDKIVTKEFDITPEVDGLKIESGYLSGAPIITPAKVAVTGPQDTISSITKVSAAVHTDKVLSSTYEFTTDELILYKDNAVISNENKQLTFDKTLFAVQVPVFVRRTLPLEVNIVNAPDGFDLEYFRSQLMFSVSELDIAAPDEKIKALSALNIGTINMREVDIGSRFEFKTENFLPAGYENLSGVDTIIVTCPKDGLAKKSIGIRGKDIQFVNTPSRFKFSTIASGMTLFLVGDEEQIAELTGEDIIAQIDLIGFNMEQTDFPMPVDFIISSYDKVWFIGDKGSATPKIYVTAELLDEEDNTQTAELS